MTDGDDKPDTYDLWLQRILRTLSGIAGIAIMGYVTVKGNDAPYIIAAALAMMGVPFAKSLEKFVDVLSRVADALRETKDEVK